MDKRIEFYKKLKNKLKEDTHFPTRYLFKFIVPSNENKVAQVEKIFDHTGAVITKTSSKTGKFISISVLVIMKSPDEIVEKYIQAESVEGIISL